MLEFEPPLIGCVISNNNFSFDLLRITKECVINIPTVELVKTVIECGNNSGILIDKFKEYSLTPVAASCVTAPLIDECYANLECRVVDEMMVEKYNFFILEVVKAWFDPQKKNPQTIHHLGEGSFMVAGETIHLPSKMK
jgi:flavin reductase (DIM6/NTAB) family NADH-FMN oxidoreductase RutF